jgi:two-component sensor histidine kinase
LLGTIAAWRAGDLARRTGVAAGSRNELTQLAAAIDRFMDQMAEEREGRAAAEARRSLLMREMHHRIKNLIATVQAIANQTFKGRATEESQRVFGQRLASMAATHDLLLSENWERADLRGTLAGALRPYGLDSGRLRLDGPALQITARAALALALAAHELCTNAAKYGALSTPAGEVAVTWRLHDAADGTGRFALQWVERGGPPVAPPEETGFGMRLIDAMLRAEFDAADVALDFPESGFRLAREAPSAGILAGGPVLETHAA